MHFIILYITAKLMTSKKTVYSVKLLYEVSVRLKKKTSEHFSCFNKLFLTFGAGDGLE